MKILYDREKDLLSIVFKDDQGLGTVVTDYDLGLALGAEDEVVCIDIPSASAKVNLEEFSIDLKHDLGPDE